ncbi:MAG: PA14 domain-containing protein [Verrucomicrobia bacterium]|nr:PA14 domain-containing protein [Verrucomicrobiota bacterium]
MFGTTTIDSTPYTTGDLNNVAPFGALGDNYGCSLSGLITPTVSGDYTFFLSSDDASQLDLNPLGPDPAGAYMIAQQTGCCNAFTEPPVDYTSAPFTLTAGTSYFIRAIQVEGGGGDYVKVAWRLSTDSTPAGSLTPIPAAYLSAYKPVPPPAFGTTTYTNGTLTINWSGYQTVAQESTDLVNWAPVPGNPNPLVVSVAGAPKKFYRLVQ